MLNRSPQIVVLVISVIMLAWSCTPNQLAKTSSASAQRQDQHSSKTNAKQPPPTARPLLASGKPNVKVNAQIQEYLQQLAMQGHTTENQGVWLQAGDRLLASHQGAVPLPAASVTKIATSLVALETLGPNHQFVTTIATTGTIKNGVLNGDLVIQGGEDPFFVWESAIAVGQLLNQRGIQRVSGNLVIVGKFYMNFEVAPLTAGSLLRQGLNAQLWTAEAQDAFQTLPAKTLRPQIGIAGTVKVLPTLPRSLTPIVRHSSLPLAELLKKMNRYSNNLMADMLANTVGGAKVVAHKAAQITGVPSAEIQLINGSGLGAKNRISPRAACALLLEIAEYLRPYQMTIADVLAIAGQDTGILEERPLPPLTIVKSGTLDQVSALVGALPTRQQGIVWFAILNQGENVDNFRNRQEYLLQTLLTQWGTIPTAPLDLTANPDRALNTSHSELLN